MRVIFYAEPKSAEAAAAFKTVPDEESLEGRWVTAEELIEMIKGSKGKHKLRGGELLEWSEYINKGGQIFPLSFIGGVEGTVVEEEGAFTLDKEC